MKPGERPNYTKIAKQYGCDRSTLSRQHRGVCASRAQGYEEQRHLNATQERQLLKYIDGLTKRGLPPTREMIRNFAAEISKKYVGKCWADRFIDRHRDKLLSHYASGKDSLRNRADSAYKYKLYFELLEQKFDKYNIEPRHMYNMDEKGFMIGMLSKMKRIFSRQRYEAGEIKKCFKMSIASGLHFWRASAQTGQHSHLHSYTRPPLETYRTHGCKILILRCTSIITKRLNEQ